MIIAKLSNKDEYRGIHPRLDRALELMTKEFLSEVTDQTRYLDGEDLYVTRFDLETVPFAETFYESHKKYLDIHIVVSGQERVDIAHPDTLTLTQHQVDFYGYEGEAEQSVVLKPGNFLVVFPGDAQRLKIAVHEPEPFSRIVFKLKVYD